MTRTNVAIASSGAFAAALRTSLVAVSAPVIARDLARAPADVSWVLTSYLLTIASLLALAGKAADLLGRKRVYLTGFVFFVAGSVMCAGALDLLHPGVRIVVRGRPHQENSRQQGRKDARFHLRGDPDLHWRR